MIFPVFTRYKVLKDSQRFTSTSKQDHNLIGTAIIVPKSGVWQNLYSFLTSLIIHELS